MQALPAHMCPSPSLCGPVAVKALPRFSMCLLCTGDSSQASAQKRKRTPEESAAAVEPLPGTGEPRQKRQVSFALPVAT
jgi:hypothetical protein